MPADPTTTGDPDTGEDLVLTGVRKSYGPVVVLDVGYLRLHRGEVVALVGENGAGKSTMMGVIAGSVAPDEGTVSIAGLTVGNGGPLRAQELGVAMVSQEFPLVGQLTVRENLLLGRRPSDRRVLVDWRAMDALARQMLDAIGLDISTRARVEALSVAQRQLLEIAKALGRRPLVLILDEPTSALGPTESERILEIARAHARSGGVVVFVGHRLNEVRAVADRVVVLRNGALIADLSPDDASEERLIREMVGKEIAAKRAPKPCRDSATPAFEAVALRGRGVGPIDLRVQPGEVLGVAGLMGSGRSHLLHLVMGAKPVEGGEMRIAGVRYEPRSTVDATRAGVGLVPEDRKVQALMVDSSIRWNGTIAALRRIARHRIVLRPRDDKLEAMRIVERARVRCRTAEQPARSLSGGNQQRLIFGRWMATSPRLLLLDEPTRGVDVGAKEEIYRLIDEQREEGMAIIVASSELEELLRICHRIVVMRQGRIAASLEHDEFNKERIIAAAAVGQAAT
ncbi:MAG TPA: sugar ABC transporter ATP-binding protein [Acidimicrobiales bacterium]|nr:sugar ABC transporter ATP-binding protein [Acidimicrobiales bacterium]